MHEAYLVLGSNIAPAQNLRLALTMLRERSELRSVSSIWKTASYEKSGPDFHNMAAHISTNQSAEDLKWKVLRAIEAELGRVRTDDKNAPRTIDLDIIIFDGQVLDEDLFLRYYVAVPLAEIIPDFIDPASGRPLHAIAEQLEATSNVSAIETNR
jgi:2-amino-4-hydroxy-6-hydroxymethyldihydropteridine diphosphokinase